MSAIGIRTGFVRDEQFEIAGLLRKLVGNRRPRVVLQQEEAVEAPVADTPVRREPSSLHKMLAYECESWNRWTNS